MILFFPRPPKRETATTSAPPTITTYRPLPGVVSQVLSTVTASSVGTPRPSVTNIITALILEEYDNMKDAEPDGEEKIESSENLLQLLSLLAALQEEDEVEEALPTRPTPPRQPPRRPEASQRPPLRPTPPRPPPQRPTPSREPFQRPTPSRPTRQPFPWQTSGPLVFQETGLSLQ